MRRARDRGSRVSLGSCAGACAWVLAATLVSLSSDALAADATPQQLQFAAQEHDLGYRAYVAKQFEEAAIHFENAFFAAPNASEVRSAIRARRDAGQLARAATLAVIAQRRYPDDAAIAKLAEATLADARARTFEIHITSIEPCNVAVDAKVVADERAPDVRFFVDPGHHELLVGWGDDRSAKETVDAAAGGSRELSLSPPPRPRAPAIERPLPTPPVSPGTKPLRPVVFISLAGLTAATGAVTLWSGIDTENNPGQSAVKADCVGRGTSCPQYQQGLSSQLRTNVLLAATGGLGIVTAVVGIFLTQWSRPEVPRASVGLRVEPLVGVGQAGLVGSF